MLVSIRKYISEIHTCYVFICISDINNRVNLLHECMCCYEWKQTLTWLVHLGISFYTPKLEPLF